MLHRPAPAPPGWATRRGPHLGPDMVFGIVETPTTFCVGGPEPIQPDNHQGDVGGRDRSFHLIGEVGADRDGGHVHEHVAGAEFDAGAS